MGDACPILFRCRQGIVEIEEYRRGPRARRIYWSFRGLHGRTRRGPFKRRFDALAAVASRCQLSMHACDFQEIS